MLESFPIALTVSTALGFLAGIGVGGGSLLIIWLTMALGMEHSIARNINLLFFLPSAAVATAFRWKQGALPWKKVLPAMIAGVICAYGFSLLSQKIDTQLLQKLFGVLLILTGIRELCWKPAK